MMRNLSKFLWGLMLLLAIPLCVKAQTDLTSKVTFSNEDFVDEKDKPITSAYRNSISGYYKMDWVLTQNPRNGDYFTGTLPEQFKFHDNITLPVAVKGLKVAELSNDGKNFKITFNENAEKLQDFSGILYVKAYVANLSEGDNTVSLPNRDIVILYTETAPKPSTSTSVNNEKIGEVINKKPTFTNRDAKSKSWMIQINGSSQDLGNKEVIVKDRLSSPIAPDTGKYSEESTLSEFINQDIFDPNTTSISPSSLYNEYGQGYKYNFLLVKKTTDNNYSYIPVLTDENVYNQKISAGIEVAFLSMATNKKSFDLHLGKNVGNSSYLLFYQSTDPQIGESQSINNLAYIYVDNKLTPPYQADAKGDAPKFDFIFGSAISTQNKNVAFANNKQTLSILAYESFDNLDISNNTSSKYLEGVEFTVQNSSSGQFYTVSPTNGDGITISDVLPAGTYTVTTTKVPNGYNIPEPKKIAITRYDASILSIPISKTTSIETTTHTVRLEWRGGSLPRPDVTVYLNRNGVRYLSAETKTLPNGTFTLSWDRLPAKDESGQPYTYTAYATSVKGYIMEKYDTTSTPNTTILGFYQETTEHTIYIHWEVDNTVLKPSHWSLYLLRNGTVLKDFDASKYYTRLVYTLDKLPAYDGDKPYYYSINVIKNSELGRLESSGKVKITFNDPEYGDYDPKITHIKIVNGLCVKPANTTGTALDTMVGFTTLGRAGVNEDNWPMVRKGGWLALEANNKGLVITRMTTAEINAIANPQEGMINYDTTAKCLKIYDGTKWSCFNTPVCPK